MSGSVSDGGSEESWNRDPRLEGNANGKARNHRSR